MRIIPFRSAAEQEAAMEAVISHLEAGGIIACPTETVYGFGCLLREDALDRLAVVKKRADDKAFLIVVSDAASIEGIEWTPAAQALAARFWPGPLTLAVRCEPGSMPRRVVAERGTVAIRATSHEGLRRLLLGLGRPITSTSANAPGGTPARAASEVVALLEPLDPDGSHIVLDGGELPPSLPSTIVDCSVEPPVLIRAGAVSPAELMETVHGIEMESGLRAR